MHTQGWGLKGHGISVFYHGKFMQFNGSEGTLTLVLGKTILYANFSTVSCCTNMYLLAVCSFNSPDNWYFYQQYFKSAYALIDEGWSPPDDER